MNTNQTNQTQTLRDTRIVNTPTSIRYGYNIMKPLVNSQINNSVSIGADGLTYYTGNSYNGNIQALIKEVENNRMPKLFFSCCNRSTYNMSTKENTVSILQSLLNEGFINMGISSSYDNQNPTYATQNHIMVSNSDGEFFPLFSDNTSNTQTTGPLSSSSSRTSLPDYSLNLLNEIRAGRYYLQLGQGIMQLPETENNGPGNTYYYDGAYKALNFVSFKLKGTKQLGFSFTFNPSSCGVVESGNSNKISKMLAANGDDVYMMYINGHNIVDVAIQRSNNADIARQILSKASVFGVDDTYNTHYIQPTLCNNDSKIDFNVIIDQFITLLNNTIDRFYSTGTYDRLSIRRGVTSIIYSYTFTALTSFDILSGNNYPLSPGAGDGNNMPIVQKIFPFFLLNRVQTLNPSTQIKPVYGIGSASGNFRVPSNCIKATSWKDYFSNDVSGVIKYNRGFADTDAMIPGASGVFSKSFGSYVVDTYNPTQTLQWTGNVFTAATVIEFE